ncbi:caspase family protein [Seonamhaeicola sp. ML3]|uniref:caspase family protein n=1 Tax=Seonamhaeicola sp. ML3 TaxID=2937786 RepID=UPI0020100F2A|nr:caspase family protein [Seonamhaeicola sp. ML3]
MKKLALIFFFSLNFLFSQEAKIEVQQAYGFGLPNIDSKNGRLLTYGGYTDQSVKIWDLYSGFLLKTMDYPALVKNIVIDKENDRTFIGDKNGIDVLDNKTLKVIQQYPIKFLKNFVYDPNSKFIYFVSGTAEFDGNHTFQSLNPNTGKIESTYPKWPSEGYPMYAKLISAGDYTMIEFKTNFRENIYFETQSNTFQLFNGEHKDFFGNLDLLYFDIVDEKHIKVVRYSSVENKTVWETVLEAGRTKTGFTIHHPTFSFTPDKSRLWVAPSKAAMYELNSETGDIIGLINSSVDKRIITADNNFVYALEPTSDTYGAPSYFNKYRRYSEMPLTTFGSPIFDVNDLETYKYKQEKGLLFKNLNGDIGSVSINITGTSVTSYFTEYLQKFSLRGDFYTSKETKAVYYGMGKDEGVKQFTIGKPLSFKTQKISGDYKDKAVVNTNSKVAVTHNKNGFSVTDLKTQELLFSETFKGVNTIADFTAVVKDSDNEVGFLILNEVVPEAVYKRRIDYYDYKNKKLLWQREGEYTNLLFIEEQTKILTLNFEKQQVEIINVSNGEIDRVFKVPDIDFPNLVLNPSENLIIFSDYKSALKVYDLESGRLISETDKFIDGFTFVKFITDQIYVTLTNGHFRFYDVVTHEEILRLYVFIDGEWLAHTPEGLFEGSQKAWNRVLFTKGADIIPLNQIFNDFYTPNLTSTILNNQKVDTEKSVYSLNKAPEVSIEFNDGTRNISVKGEVQVFETNSKAQRFKLQADAFGDAIKEMRLYHNGKRVLASENSSDFAISLIEGENVITAVAVNSQNTESATRKVIAKYRPKKTEPKSDTIEIHLLTIGIDKYKNPRYNLNYAVADALGFKKAVMDGVKGFIPKIHTYSVQDKDANKANIINALKTIAEQSNPQDVFVFYYAGHGMMSEGDSKDFFLIPHDITQLFGNDDILNTKGVSATEIKDLSAIIPAQKQLFILDACQSGGAINTLASRGVAEEKAIAQLARSTGTHWLTASGSDQFATEFEKLGHGVFTYALLEALSGKADNGDSKVTVNELKAYLEVRVPEISEQYKGSAQYPASFGFGQDFPLSVKR